MRLKDLILSQNLSSAKRNCEVFVKITVWCIYIYLYKGYATLMYEYTIQYTKINTGIYEFSWQFIVFHRSPKWFCKAMFESRLCVKGEKGETKRRVDNRTTKLHVNMNWNSMERIKWCWQESNQEKRCINTKLRLVCNILYCNSTSSLTLFVPMN